VPKRQVVFHTLASALGYGIIKMDCAARRHFGLFGEDTMSSAKTAGSIALIVMGLIFLCVGLVLVGFGGLYLMAAHSPNETNPGGRLALGAGMLVAGLVVWAVAAVVAFFAWRRMQPKPEQKVTIRQEVDLTGGVELASLACQKCAATLDKSAITVREGAVFVNCPFCGATYQIVEEPKW
jgi:hypothetical protein